MHKLDLEIVKKEFFSFLSDFIFLFNLWILMIIEFF
jgi:hypothetical protein